LKLSHNNTFGGNPIKTVLASIYNALQTFTLDGGFDRYEALPPQRSGIGEALIISPTILAMSFPLVAG
jgi:hypothetical protein